MSDVHSFVKDLKLKYKVFTQKQCLVIDDLYIYFNDSVVYRVIVNVNPCMMKKALKLGLTKEHIVHECHQLLDLDEKYKSGRFIAIYNVNNSECNVYGGEESENEQIERIKHRPNIC